jgi:hypothetical protein
MNRDDIIRMAKEAGFVTDEADFIYPPKTPRRGIGLEIERVIVLAAAAEREACAKYVAESFGKELVDGQDVAAAIRARGEA